MGQRSAVTRYLDLQQISYTLIDPPFGNRASIRAIRAEGVRVGGVNLLAILPAPALLDVSLLEAALGASIQTGAVTGGDILAPLPGAYGYDACVDKSVIDCAEVCFRIDDDCYALLATEDARQLWTSASTLDFARSPAAFIRPEFETDTDHDVPAADQSDTWPALLRRRVEALNDLPPMPELAHRLLCLRNDPMADADDLAKIIELDPALASKVIRYATSPFYGYRGRIDTLRDAVTRVLGFDMVMNLATGMLIGSSLRIQREGVLGLDAFWMHAVRSAAVCEALANQMPRDRQVRPGMAYLAGLLHDIGHLALGHVFKPGFELLNRTVAVNAGLSVLAVESHVLGVRHDQIGAWLMRAWHMPDEIAAVTRRHHEDSYRGDHYSYTGLTLIADRVLRRYGDGDADGAALPDSVLELLGLSAEQVLSTGCTVLERDTGFEELAMQFAA